MNLSIIIPAYNCEKTIEHCLKSIFDSAYKDFEVIVVNDCSTDSTLERIKKYNCKIINLKENKGAGNARNIGAKYAKADLLVFIDSDIVLHKDTLTKMIKIYKSDPNIKIINAFDSGRCLSNSLGRKFVTLKYHYDYKWKKNEKRREFSCLQTACCLIEKSIFNEIGGFNVKYKKSGGEEYEIYHRLSEKNYKSYMYRDILYDHHHENMKKRLSKLLRRSTLHLPFLLKRKKFETRGATGTMFEAFMTLFSFLGLITLPLILISIKLAFIPFLFFMIVLIANLNFFIYLAKRQNILFSLLSIFFLVSTHFVISLGIIRGVIKLIQNRGYY